MTVENDNILDGLSYEQALLLVCDNDKERYNKAYKECLSILSGINVRSVLQYTGNLNRNEGFNGKDGETFK